MIKLILLILLLVACVPLPASCPECTLSHKHTEYGDTEAYYRGVYSFCMVLNAQALESGADRFFDCNEMVKSAYRLKWHERDTPGFEWPPGETSERLDDTAMNYVK